MNPNRFGISIMYLPQTPENGNVKIWVTNEFCVLGSVWFLYVEIMSGTAQHSTAGRLGLPGVPS